MQKHNFHTHTVFSDGHDSVREMIECAISCGFTSLGFSDHSYTYYQRSFCLPANFGEIYIDRVRSEAEKYADRIKVYAGIELDSESEVPHEDYDYILASVHDMSKNGNVIPIDFSPEEETRLVNEMYGGSWIEFSKAYYDKLVNHVIRNKADIVGHVDLITKYGLVPEGDQKYSEIAVEAVREIAKYCRTFELNTGAIARGLRSLPYPNGFILRELKSLGCRVIVTSDCHFKEKLTTWFDEAEEYLASYGFKKSENENINDKIHGISMWI
ncbi:MAG: histidinol-phosphatase HisJ family protein [Ruminococcaceae bacterium]|nr:histidinol-phosphatase HisJ family protein [Oscillospiraceae bacterium]